MRRFKLHIYQESRKFRRLPGLRATKQPSRCVCEPQNNRNIYSKAGWETIDCHV